jgi:Flp pilus assembly protein TadB
MDACRCLAILLLTFALPYFGIEGIGAYGGWLFFALIILACLLPMLMMNRKKKNNQKDNDV